MIDAVQQQAYDTLRQAFSALDNAQIENLRFHLRKETPVLCRERASEYVDVNSGAG